MKNIRATGGEGLEDVLPPHPVPEPAPQHPSSRGATRPSLDAGDLVAVDGRDRHVAGRDAQHVELDQQVVLELVALGDAVELQPLERAAVDRGVAVLRVEEVPVARRRLGQERQADVADDAVPRHAREGALAEEPVGLGEVGLAVSDRVEQRRAGTPGPSGRHRPSPRRRRRRARAPACGRARIAPPTPWFSGR